MGGGATGGGTQRLKASATQTTGQQEILTLITSLVHRYITAKQPMASFDLLELLMINQESMGKNSWQWEKLLV